MFLVGIVFALFCIYIINQNFTIMASIQDFKDQLKRVTDATDNIAADLKRLADQIEQGGISATEEAEIVASLKAAADKLEEVAAINPEPETPTEPIEPA